MVIQHNISALNAHRYMGINNSETSSNLEKLSSGYKVNRAGDDAAGLAISEKMRGQIRGLTMAEQNTENGVSLIQTAEGGLNETHSILQRMRELAVQSANGTYQDSDRDQITLEYEALKSEIDRIADSTHYNGIKLLNGNLSSAQSTKIAEDTSGVVKSFSLGNFSNAVKGDMLEVTLGVIYSNTSTASVGTHAVITMNFASANKASENYIDNTAGEILTLQIGNDKIQIELTTASMTATDVAKLVAAKLENYSDGSWTVNSDFDGKVVLTAKEVGAISVLDNLTIKATASGIGANAVVGTLSGGTNADPIVFTMSGTANIQNLTDPDRLGDGQNGINGDGFSLSATYNASDNTWTLTNLDLGVSMTLDASKIPQDANAANITFKMTVTEGENLVFQIGANGGQDQRVSLNVDNMDSKNIGLKMGDAKSDGTIATAGEAEVLAYTSVGTRELANKAIDVITAATNQVSAQRAQLGALQNRLEHTLNNLGTTKENLTAAESSIRDTDMAEEMMEFTKNNILVQAAQAMLAQANQLPQGVLQLLR